MIQLIEQNHLLTGLFVLIGICYFYYTRFVGNPPAVRKHAVSILLADFIILPTLIILAIHFVEFFGKYPVVRQIVTNQVVVQSGLLHLVVFWLIARGLDVVFMQRYFQMQTGYAAPNLLRGLVFFITLFFGLALFLWRIGYPLTGFLLSTGVIAGVVGLAMQNNLINLFSGIAFSLEKPFRIGDWIELENGTVGQVIEMTWRATWLKTFNNTIVTVPNLTLASQSIINLNMPNAYSVWYMFKISPEIEPANVKTVLATAVGRCRHILTKPAPSIRLANATEMPYQYSVWVHFRNYLAHFRGREELFTQIHLALSQAGITVSADIQEVNYAKKRALNPINLKISDTLRSLTIFAELTDEEITQIASESEHKIVEVDTELMHEYEKICNVYIVLNGNLESSITLENGRKLIGQQFSVGDSFGWTAIAIEEVAFMTVKAVSDSLVLSIDGETLKAVISKHEHLVTQFTEIVTERMNNLDQVRLSASRGRILPRSSAEIKSRIEQFFHPPENQKDK